MVQMFDLLSGCIPEDHSRQVTSGYLTRYLLAQYEAIEKAQRRGGVPPWHTPLGGEVFIHGEGARDWTRGCVALENKDMHELFATVPVGTGVKIYP